MQGEQKKKKKCKFASEINKKMNKTNFNNILQYITMALLAIIAISIFVLLVFISKYSGNKIPSYYLYLILAGLIIVGFGLYKFLRYLDNIMFKNAETININEFIKWKRIKIKPEDIQVISSPFYQEVSESSNWRIQGLDSFSNDNGVIREKIDMIYLKYKFENKTYKQLVAERDEISLKMKLLKMEYIELCINPNDKNDYFFDL